MGEPDVRGRVKENSPESSVAVLGDGLRFDSVSVDVGARGDAKRVLWGVSGHAPEGEMLAIMGPSGSGKTTLLNSLAGYIPFEEGTVTLNGAKLGRKNRRKISYVLQADIFFANLTLRETLRFSALLRLPMKLSFKEKLAKVEEIIHTLHLEECANTIIGNAIKRGLSGGEKKRANIGCELLTNPLLLLLDEPTSGLDSSGALSLLKTVKELAHVQGKTVVTSIHQPSSQMYHMFDKLLLLAKGKVAYFGPASQAMAHFSRLGLSCTLHYNPADYMLELVTNADTRKLLIGEDPKSQQSSSRRWSRWKACCVRRRESRGISEDSSDLSLRKEEEEAGIIEYPESPRFPRKDSLPFSSSPRKQSRDSVSAGSPGPKWPTPWYWQFLVLTARTFWQSRHVILSRLNLAQAILISIIASIIWFQIPMLEDTIRDRYGLLFFTVVYWGFNPLFLATSTFPAERVVISKERDSGSYHLSAYYLAKTLSELPLVVILPSFYVLVVYWAAGLNGAAAFFGSLFVVILNSFVTQSLGLFLGAVIMDFQGALVASGVLMLSSMLLGGFYVETLPFWLDWAQYLSFTSYSFSAMVQLEFTSNQIYSCNENASAYLSCDGTANATISGPDVVEGLGISIPFYGNILALIGFAVVLRTLAYLSLRFLHRKK